MLKSLMRVSHIFCQGYSRQRKPGDVQIAETLLSGRRKYHRGRILADDENITYVDQEEDEAMNPDQDRNQKSNSDRMLKHSFVIIFQRVPLFSVTNGPPIEESRIKQP
ncbi:hypothetical protein RF11_04860 [Thelohanellus kitauei]|uniref:Uncharacterized protein n=1 Tax=Thelohanellus kitauei TaxID=669202 RepID=A0A0C2JC17_THEKT|nr:hypothetical protein RF11_04860 [Thelohanellus kitauei]